MPVRPNASCLIGHEGNSARIGDGQMANARRFTWEHQGAATPGLCRGGRASARAIPAMRHCRSFPVPVRYVTDVRPLILLAFSVSTRMRSAREDALSPRATQAFPPVLVVGR